MRPMGIAMESVSRGCPSTSGYPTYYLENTTGHLRETRRALRRTLCCPRIKDRQFQTLSGGSIAAS